jgi:peptidoglycan/LPS O-acetylase OafA/YrhL
MNQGLSRSSRPSRNGDHARNRFPGVTVGELLRAMGRAAFAAFVVHQLILVGLILLSRHAPWPREVEYLLVSVTAVAASFAMGHLLTRIPAVARF